jgi:membrane-anchored glycerophosphoryl diester phosphodiesterase (GDPDase)
MWSKHSVQQSFLQQTEHIRNQKMFGDTFLYFLHYLCFSIPFISKYFNLLLVNSTTCDVYISNIYWKVMWNAAIFVIIL